MDPSVPSSNLLDIEDQIIALRYIVGSTLVIYIWDTLVTLDQEVDNIWSAPFGLPQFVFLLNRYGNMVCMIFANYMFSGLGSHTSELVCKVFLVIYNTPMAAYSFFYATYIAFRVYVLWDQSRKMKIILCIALAVTYIPAGVLIGFANATFYRNTIVSPQFNSCIVTAETVLFKVFFACIFAYDVLVVILMSCNALARPRRPQHKLATDLRRDGAIWFFILFGMRLVNLFLLVFLPITKVLLVLPITWTIISITISRMIMYLEAMRIRVSHSRRRVRTVVKTWVPGRDAFELEEANSTAGTPNGSVSPCH